MARRHLQSVSPTLNFVTLLATMLWLAACPTTLGDECQVSADCDAGDLCVDQRCVEDERRPFPVGEGEGEGEGETPIAPPHVWTVNGIGQGDGFTCASSTLGGVIGLTTTEGTFVLEIASSEVISGTFGLPQRENPTLDVRVTNTPSGSTYLSNVTGSVTLGATGVPEVRTWAIEATMQRSTGSGPASIVVEGAFTCPTP